MGGSDTSLIYLASDYFSIVLNLELINSTVPDNLTVENVIYNSDADDVLVVLDNLIHITVYIT